MKCKNKKKGGKFNVLLTGPHPPPSGGIATFCDLLKKNMCNYEYQINHPVLGKSGREKRFIIRIARRINIYVRFLSNLNKISPKIVHINTASYNNFYFNSIFLLLSKITLKKTILHIHGGGFKDFYENSNAIKKKIIKLVLDSSDVIVTLSERWKNFFEKITVKDKIAIIPNSIEVEYFNESNSDIITTDNLVKISFLGSLSKKKGFYDIVEAIKIIKKKNKRCLFTFAGEYDKTAISEVNMLDVSEYVEYFGELYGDDKIKFLKTSDIFILPSFIEGLPIAMLEAMAASLPVIVTPVGAIPEVIKDNINGFVIPVGNYKALAEKIILLVSNEKLRKKMGKANSEKINNEFNIKLNIKKIVNIYNGMLFGNVR